MNPSDFELDPHRRRHFRLIHIGGAMFSTEPERGLPWVEMKWGEGHRRGRFALSWKRPLAAWLKLVRREIETPDLWAEFKAEQELLEASPTRDSDNTVFTPEEQAEIREQLDTIGVYALNSGDFTDGEFARLKTKLDELVEASRYARRFEWRDQLVGALLGAVAGNVLPQGATVQVLQMAIRSIGHLLGQSGMLPP
jgi:hypothetical protein